MDDKNSSLFIDPYKFPSDEDIKKKWHTWQGSEKACEGAAIKWLKCMSITKAGFFLCLCLCAFWFVPGSDDGTLKDLKDFVYSLS